MGFFVSDWFFVHTTRCRERQASEISHIATQWLQQLTQWKSKHRRILAQLVIPHCGFKYHNSMISGVKCICNRFERTYIVQQIAYLTLSSRLQLKHFHNLAAKCFVNSLECIMCARRTPRYLIKALLSQHKMACAILRYHQISYISRTLVGNVIVDYSYVVGTSPAGAAPTASSFSASIDCAKTTARWCEKHLSFGIWCDLY